MTRDQFIKEVTAGILPPPKYFFEDARINKNGYESIDEVVEKNSQPLSVDEFKKEVAKGALIVDSRTADDFEKGFIPGSINIGLNGQYAIWAGTLIDIHQSIVLVTKEGEEKNSVLRLARVGFENVKGYLQGGINSWKEKLETVKSIAAEDMKLEMEKGCEIMDVRKPGEWAVAHVKGATFLPLAEMPNNLKGLEKNKTYIVHCGGGYRSMTAISIMKRNGFAHLINVYGGFGSIQNAGVEVVAEKVSIH
jgi:rhodanese-related sulfurtransferase